MTSPSALSALLTQIFVLMRPKEQPPQPDQAEKKEGLFAERRFAEIIVVISTLVLSSTTPFWVGLCIGTGLRYLVSPKLRLKENERICNVANTTLAFIGMMAAVVQKVYTGEVSFIFRSLYFIGSAAIGSTLYRGFASVRSYWIPEKNNV